MAPFWEHLRSRAVVVTAVVFLVLMCVPVALVGVYRRTSDTIDAQVFASQSALVDLAAQAVRVKLDGLVTIASSMASSTALVTDVAGSKWTDAADAARDMQNDVKYYDPFIDRIIIYDPQGIQRAAYPALVGGLGTSAASGSWYAALSSGKESSYVTNVILRTSKPQIQVVSVAVPIKGPSGTVAGFLVLQIPTDNFLAFGENISPGTYSFAYIVDQEGNIVAHPKYSSDNGEVVNYAFNPAVKNVMNGESGTLTVQDSGVVGIVTYRPVADYGWGVIGQELSEEAFAGNSSILFDIRLLIGILTIVNLLIVYMLFRILSSRP
ncbi:MAG: cache domain-containing protein [Candidatus Pacebacteria bacterium]|nr:cache domain-containing protein [Candidatus Paceibacterota bacterium]